MTRRTTFRMLPAVAVLALTTAAHAFSPLLASASVSAYRSAVANAKKGKTAQASAVIDGLLLRRQVRIAIDPDGAPTGRADDYLDGIHESVDIWSNALGETPFTVVEPGEKADLTVRFVSKITKGGEIQGAIDAQRRFFWNAKSSGYELAGGIQIRNNAYGHTLSGVEVGRVMAHELGHLLGLSDNYESHGVMGSFRLGEGRIQPNDDEASAVTEFRQQLRDFSKFKQEARGKRQEARGKPAGA